jgi:uncharacterized protein (TIGR00297 family)
MDGILLTAVAVATIALLSALAYKCRCLTPAGAVASFAVGSVVALFGSFSAFLLLTVFTVAGFAATFAGMRMKKDKGIQEGAAGERDWKNVVGVGAPPCIVVLVNYFLDLDPTLFAVMFISTITVAGADTIASEVGAYGKKTYLITTMEPVEPGVNGGISALGTSVSTLASFLIALLGWYLLTGTVQLWFLIPFAAGVAGNLLDSLFGVLLEDRGHMSKYTNNASTAMIGAGLGSAMFMVI